MNTSSLTPMAPMNGRQLVAWMDRHGGLQAIHVHPCPGGWANTLVCVDGVRITTSADQDAAINRVLNERGMAEA